MAVMISDDDEPKSEPVLCFMEALPVFELMKALMYAHQKRRANILNIERLLFSLKRKGNKQVRGHAVA
jgi:hypothetical protein